MLFYKIEEIGYLKDSEMLFQKIEKIKAMAHEMGCAADVPSSICIENSEMVFNLRISIPLLHALSVENLNSDNGEKKQAGQEI